MKTLSVVISNVGTCTDARSGVGTGTDDRDDRWKVGRPGCSGAGGRGSGSSCDRWRTEPGTQDRRYGDSTDSVGSENSAGLVGFLQGSGKGSLRGWG